MKIVVIGGTSVIGSKALAILRPGGHEVGADTTDIAIQIRHPIKDHFAIRCIGARRVAWVV